MITLAIIFGLVFITTGPILIAYGWKLADAEARAMTGKVLPFKIDPRRPIEIQVGGFHVITTLDHLSAGFNLSRYVNLGFNYPFQIRMQDRKFLVSVDIQDVKGETVAKIVDNQWAVNTNPVIAHDRNYNSYAFEVINSDLVPVIQVIFYPGNKMYLGGLIYGPNNTTLLMFNDTTIINPSPEDITQNRNPIFEYPSGQHLGEMVGKSQYKVPRVSTIVITIGGILTALGIILTAYSTIITVSSGHFKKERKRKHHKGERKSVRTSEIAQGFLQE